MTLQDIQELYNKLPRVPEPRLKKDRFCFTAFHCNGTLYYLYFVIVISHKVFLISKREN